MTEAIFPVFGAVLVFLCVLPATALLAKLALIAVDKLPFSWSTAQQGLRYFMIVMASAAPLLWFVSASLHQAESGEPPGVCAIEHAAQESLCPEPWFFALALSLYCSGFALRRSSSRTTLQTRRRARNLEADSRVAALIAARPGLQGLVDRCEAFNDLPIAIATVGVLRPRVVLDAKFVESLDDDAIEGALYHELEHIRGRDPLRYLLASWALWVNPWGRIVLDGEMRQWRFQRELQCDREAVACGANPTAVAQAIVTAARRSIGDAVAALGENDGRALKLRVEFLLAYAEHPPLHTDKHTGFGATIFAAIALATLPHAGRNWALDAIHMAVETTILAIAS